MRTDFNVISLEQYTRTNMYKDMIIDDLRRAANQQLDPQRKGELGQFMTSARVADFMASLFQPQSFEVIRLLDAGAGVGSLTAAFLEHCFAQTVTTRRIELTVYEIDPLLRTYLEALLAYYQTRAEQSGLELKADLCAVDFIEDAVDRILYWNTQNFTHAILNPPYKKILSNSQHRKSLRAVQIETVNLYSAFVALAIDLMADGGEIVAIVPRSFCNGPYYRPFRERLLGKTAIQHIHLFKARDQAFKDDEVLQENIIMHLIKGGVQESVTLSTSTDERFDDYTIYEAPFDLVVRANDQERFIHIPTTPEQNALELSLSVQCSLGDLKIEVSTGPVVDFRLKEHLREQPDAESVPLLYPGHFTPNGLEWPQANLNKPNALRLCPETKKWLFPKGFYAVVRRFSSKEEKRRIVASIVRPNMFDTDWIGFENHLNVFHRHKQGLPEELAYGVALFLNSTFVDEYFRRFSGHTQVNATDLRMLKYPSLDILCTLGCWVKSCEGLTQEKIDQKVASVLWPNTN